MKFIKGFLIGGAISMGIVMLCNQSSTINGRKVLRRGKKFAKKMGVI